MRFNDEAEFAAWNAARSASATRKARPAPVRPPAPAEGKPRDRRQREHAAQVMYFKWVRALAETDERFRLIFAIPNEGRAGAGLGAYMKAEGVQAGCPDVALMIPNGAGYHGGFIEAKIEPNEPSPEQEAMMAALIGAGYWVRVAWGRDEMELAAEMKRLTGEYLMGR